MEYRRKYGLLVAYLKKLESVLVALSGGVDSSLLLTASLEALGRDRVLAVTAASPIHPPEEVEEAGKLANTLGARWRRIKSNEMNDAEFLANPPERCYFCKRGMLFTLQEMARREGLSRVVEGSNLDDLNDFRPGFRAVREAGAVSPLLEAGLTKEEIRAMAREKGLAAWDRLSDACLCSRIPYGQRITPGRLERIYRAECVIKELGAARVRVRDHGEIARLEVSAGDIEMICREAKRERITRELNELGFKYVTVDLNGYRTGSMN